MKEFAALFLIILIFTNNLCVFAQRKQSAPPPILPTQVTDLGSDNPLDNFSEKGLPLPYFVGEIPSDKLAAKLAAKISQYDDNSLPVLMGTLQKSGFYIIDVNQKTLYKPTVQYDMELAFYDFEVAGMLKSSGLGVVTSIKKLAQVIAQNDKEVSADKLGQLILDDLRTARNSKDRRLSFFANLIFELGKQFPTPIDLTSTLPEDSKISIIQASLIERVLLGDLIDSYSKLVGGNSSYRKSDLFKSDRVRFVNAGFSGKRSGFCEMWEDLTTIQKTEKNIYKGLDKMATFGKAIEEGGLPSEAVKVKRADSTLQIQHLEKFGKGLKVANIVLGWLKMLMALLNIKMEFKTDKPLPLERTKSSRNSGFEREVTVKISMDAFDKQKTDNINCAGKVAEFYTGIKFSLPKPGSMADNPVGWELTAGTGIKNLNRDSPVLLDSLDHTDTSKQKTDANGESKVKLTGKPQPEDLTERKVIQIGKSVGLRVTVALERMKFGDDVSKISKLMLEDFGLGMLLAIFEILPEMLGKMKITTRTFEVPIRDWQPCTEDWSGVINIKREYSRTFVVKGNREPNGNSTGDGYRSITIDERVAATLNPRKPEEIQTKPPKPADIIVYGKYTDFFSGQIDDNPCCGNEDGSWDTKFTRSREETFNDFVKKPVNVVFAGGDRDYSLAFFLTPGDFETKVRNAVDVTETNCSLEELGAKDEETKGIKILNFILPIGRYGDRIFGPEGEQLYGTKEFNEKDGSKITWNWALRRCKN